MKLLSTLLIRGTLAIIVIICFSFQGIAQNRGNDEPRVSPNATVSQTVGTTQITITYGRPGVKGRKVYGDLVPYNQPWRTGANESTNITFSKAVTLGGQQLDAGTYSLYTIPRADKWTIIINSKLSWGTEYDQSKDVLRFDVQPEEAEHQEWLMFSFQNLTDSSATAVMHWANRKVPFTIKI